MATLFPKLQTYYSVSGSRVNGIWSASETPGTFKGGIQPATGKDVENLPVGKRDRGAVKIFSNVRLQTSSEGTGTPGDRVVFQGRKWEVTIEKPWQNGLIPHFEYLAVEFGEVSP